jgi:hypothetical protein
VTDFIAFLSRRLLARVSLTGASKLLMYDLKASNELLELTSSVPRHIPSLEGLHLFDRLPG